MPSNLVNAIRSFNSLRMGSLLKKALISSPTNRVFIPLPYQLRVLVAELLPVSPIPFDSMSNLDSIEVVVPCVAKDVDLLPLCLHGVLENCQNPIEKITIISNQEIVITDFDYNCQITVELETKVLPDFVLRAISELIPVEKRGWVTKQVLAMYVAYNSNAPGVLVIDADTVLTANRSFLNRGVQILLPVVEYNKYDADTTELTWPIAASLPVSFTAHHLLLQPKYVRSMFDSIGGLESGIRKWLASTNQGESWKPLSDMHSYSTWLIRNSPKSAVLARWGNLRVSRDNLQDLSRQDSKSIYREIESKYPKYMSVSFHHYLDSGFVGSE